MGRIFYLMGKSASGKDTLYKRLLEENTLNLKNVVLYTTRPIRHNETNGKEYFFVDEAYVKQLEEENKVIEKRVYQTVHGDWTYLTVADDQMNDEDADYLMMGTLESFRKIRDYYGEEKIVPLYVYVEDGERLQRALNREKKQENPRYLEMCRRFLADAVDFSQEELLHCKIAIEKNDEVKYHGYKNHDLEECLGEVSKEIRSYHTR